MDSIIRDLTKTYRGHVQALTGVDLEVPTGMFGLLGPNGAGKTTLMRILAGILRPSSGGVPAGEYDLSGERGRSGLKRVLGYLPQDLGVYPDLTARQFLDYIAILKGLDVGTARRRRVDELLSLVGLDDVAGRKLKGFSGGMKRRVGIAQALLNDPRLLIVDEPAAGLDPEERIRFRTLLVELAGDRTVVLSTHIVEDIAQTSHRLAVLNGGRVIFHGTAGELVGAARGRVWNVTTVGHPSSAEQGTHPAGGPYTSDAGVAGVGGKGDVTVVSMVQRGHGIEYRVIGEPRGPEQRQPVEPSLEDGYVCLMRDLRAEMVA